MFFVIDIWNANVYEDVKDAFNIAEVLNITDRVVHEDYYDAFDDDAVNHKRYRVVEVTGEVVF